MASEKIREWVRDKLDEGVEEERIRKSLENTGHDPSIVDDVKSPFGEKEVDEDPFEEKSREETEEETEDVSGSSGSVSESQGSQNSSRSFDPGKFFDRRLLAVPVFLTVVAGSILLLSGSAQDEPVKQCVGVKIYSLDVRDGSTVARVRSMEEARVVLEVFKDGEKVGEGSRVLKGTGEIKVNKVGDRASFHGLGCPEQSSDRRY